MTRRRALRILTALLWAIALTWLILDPGFEPLYIFVAGVAALFGSLVAPGTGSTAESEQRVSASWFSRVGGVRQKGKAGRRQTVTARGGSAADDITQE